MTHAVRSPNSPRRYHPVKTNPASAIAVQLHRVGRGELLAAIQSAVDPAGTLVTVPVPAPAFVTLTKQQVSLSSTAVLSLNA
jgi:hypothetical protein